VGNILHKDAHPVSTPNPSCFKEGSNLIHESKNIRVGVFLETIGVVQNKGRALRSLFCPLFDSIEDPAAAYRRIAGGPEISVKALMSRR
jgi:hypothetical protein